MKNALIGYTGFVGSTLIRQANFDAFYRSSNIQEIDGNQFNIVACAGAPAKKWIANQNPEDDFKCISSLIEHLRSIKCNTFVLVSTVDVFKVPIGVDEDTSIDESGLHPYGLHRRMLEKFVQEHFSQHLIVRLPGLVGPGLRKNIIFDFLNSNNIGSIDSRGVFQFYPMVNLWYDIQSALALGIKLIHLTAEPISVESVSLQGFGRRFTQPLSGEPAKYDMQSKYGNLCGSNSPYQYNALETIQAIRTYAQSEPRILNLNQE